MKKTNLILGFMLIMLLAVSSSLMADTHYVDLNGSNTSPYTTPGTAAHTLTAAIGVAINGDIIDVTGTITEAGITIDKNLTIQGQSAGSTIVQAHATQGFASDRVFDIASGKTVTIKDMTIRHGKLTGFMSCGGGIDNSGTLTLTNCTVSGNLVALAYGGGIHSHESSTLTLTNCTVSGNSGNFYGGGIYSHMNSTLTLTNCTVSGNSSVDDNGGGIFVYGTTTLTNCTISGNSAGNYGGGIYNRGGTTHIKNTIIANNTASGGADYHYNSGTLTDNGYNVVEYSNVGATATGGFNNADDILYNTKYNDAGTGFTSWTEAGVAAGTLSLSSTLALNNNPNGTFTLSYTDGSSIGIDDGTGTDADQRGATVYSDTKDIGAYEWQGSEGTLPVELSTFTVQYLNNSPTLYWVTQSEKDNIGWYIYRNNAEDFENAERITNGLIDGYGTTTEQHSYLYKDNDLVVHSGDIYWYWIQNIDFGGKINTYEPQKLIIPNIEPEHYEPEIPIEYRLQSSPNPANFSTTISFTINKSTFAEVSIYNILGELVKTLPMVITTEDEKSEVYWNGKDEDGNAVKDGIYLYRLNVDGKPYKTNKLILLR